MGRIRMRQIEVMELEQHDYLFPTMTNAHFIGYRTSSIFAKLNNGWLYLPSALNMFEKPAFEMDEIPQKSSFRFPGSMIE